MVQPDDDITHGPLERIQREAGVADLVEILSERIPPTDLQSLLLEVYRRRAARLSARDVLTRYAENRFTHPSSVDPMTLALFEMGAWSSLPEGYQAIELSPLCPLGTNSAIATVDQNKAISTIRNTEVVSDSTNVLTLEAALRRRRLRQLPDTRSVAVRLATSQRQVRAQLFGAPGAFAHFRLIGLVAAGRDAGGFTFQAEELRRQIGYAVTLIRTTHPDWRIEVAMTDLAGRSRLLEDAVLGRLAAQSPDASYGMDPTRMSGRGYYVDACWKVFAVLPSGERREMGDGGCTTWSRQLQSDDKEQTVISGFGVDRLLI
jgi:hypothetical protein